MKKHELNKINKERILEVLKKHEITAVTIHYDGSGDSGQVESVVLTKNGEDVDSEKIANLDTVKIVSLKTRFVPEGHKQETREEEVDLDDALRDFAEAVLDAEDIDWYNNDGGYGDVIFDVATGKVTLNHEARYTETESSSYEI